jgi:Winged helix DNA-binding domain
MELTRAQVVGYRVATQGLLREQASVDDLRVLDIGVQDSAGSAALALDARAPSTPDGTSLALAWTLRGAPHLHRRPDLDWLASALWPLSDADALSRLDASASMRKSGIGGLSGLVTVVEAMRRVVRAPTDKGAVSTAITKATEPALHRYCRSCQATHIFEGLFRLASLPAGLELEPGTAPPVLVPRDGAARTAAADPDAVRRLIRSYLTLLGPATPADVAGYLDARRADLTKLWPDDLEEVSVDGRTAWLPSEAVAAAKRARPPRLTRLLGPFDPYLQARDRDLIVPDPAVHRALWPILGRPGVLFVDGEVVGTWRPKSAKARLEITVESFVPLPPPVRRAIDDEAQRVATVRGARDVTVRLG